MTARATPAAASEKITTWALQCVSSHFRFLVALAMLGALSSCSGRLVAPQPSRNSMHSFAATAAGAPAMARSRAIARLKPGVSAADFSSSYGSSVIATIPELDLVLVSVSSEVPIDSFVRTLRSDPRVIFAEPDYAALTAESRQSTIAFSEGTRSWGDVADQEALARIGAPEAQVISQGSGVLVAVLDTGVELDHPALAAHLDLPGIEPGVTTNPGDDRAEGVDTNGDGLVDGALGHGTHVAGIVLAVAPHAQILPVRVLDSDGVGYAFAIARGLVLAAGRGARIANLSLGMPTVSEAVAAALDYVHALGVVVVAPTGNDDQQLVEFPASFLPVVAVAGTDDMDRKAIFSNYGDLTDSAAPAVGILSTFVGGGYAIWSGTSMAAPMVAGVSALLYERLGDRNPANAGLAEGALRLGAQSLAPTDPTFSSLLGAGRVAAAWSLYSLGAPSSSGGGMGPGDRSKGPGGGGGLATQ